MGTFKDSLKKWFFTQGTQPTIAENTRVPLLDVNGEPIGSASPTEIYRQMPFLTGNVGLCGTSTIQMVLGKDYAEIASQTHPGVWIYEAGHLLVVAKDSTVVANWATRSAAGGTENTTAHEAIADFNGQTKTQTIYSTLGDDATAAKYALEYAPTGLEESDIYGVGKWWMPSVGEMMMILSHIQEVNYLLSLIGGEPINASVSRNYYTSTEYKAQNSHVITVTEYGFYLRQRLKTYTGYVRPVCALY